MRHRVATLVEVEVGVFIPADMILDEKGRMCEVGLRDIDGNWAVFDADPKEFCTLSSVVDAAVVMYRNEPRRFARREEAAPHG